MYRIISLFIVVLAILNTPLHAQTNAQLRGGVVINEILPDPTGDMENFDTDGNGTAAAEDEFVELFNVSDSEIDVGGLELWDEGSGKWLTIPENTTVESLAFVVIVVGVQSGGSVPSVGTGSEAFDAGQNSGVLNNGGDNIVLFDPDTEEYIQATYNGATEDDPTTYDQIPGSATRVGDVAVFGDIPEGVSKVRDPSGYESYKDHNNVSSDNASPGQSGGVALPVEFAAFQVTADDGRALLSWQTASETNNAGFAVEHREGETGRWRKIDFVDGMGTTAQPHSYQVRTEPLQAGRHAFRLRQIDIDGTTHPGPEQSVIIAHNQGLSLSGPNPIPKGQISTVTVTTEVAQTVDVALYNVLGQRVQTVLSSRITPERPFRTQVSTSNLSSGVYFLRAEGVSVKKTQRLVITR